jgi:8-oxo-dGTP diphosphatase
MAGGGGHGRFAVAVDLVVLAVRDGRLCALAGRRDASPYRGRLGLPGGFVADDEGLETAARRELAQTPVAVAGVHLEQLASYGEPGRDPRGRTVSVAWLAIAPLSAEPVEPAEGAWRPVDELLGGGRAFAFDHRQILRDGVERAGAKLEYSTLATAFCGEEFTIADLRHVYEVVWGHRLDPGNFHRKVTGTDGFVVEVTGHAARRSGRPAQLYRRGPAALLHPPLTRGYLGA